MNETSKQQMICFLMSLATTIPIAFLESNCFRPLSELFSSGKDPNVLIQGRMDRSYGALTSWRLIWCVRINLECTWKCGDFSEFGYVKLMVSHRQELLVGFIPPLVLTIFLQDEFQKWVPHLLYRGQNIIPFSRRFVVPQIASPYSTNLASNFGIMIG